jgi:release factor glutamine methyltransferase
MQMGNTMCNKSKTIGALLICGYEKLKNAGIESYQIDSQILLSKVMDKDRIYILTHRDMPVGEDAAEEYMKLIELREKKMPIKYMLGECEFMGYVFKVREGVLIPRPDTEVLVENVISRVKERGYKRICDVCTGSGIIGITVAKECEETEVLCLDISSIALETAMENAKNLGVSERVEVVFSDLLGYALERELRFDVIVSNPPYIRTSDIGGLMADVKEYEPFEALCGGEDGLEFYRKITEQSMMLLRKDGMLAFEIGYDQRDDVMNILAEKGFGNIATAKDLSGNDRVVLGFRN